MQNFHIYLQSSFKKLLSAIQFDLDKVRFTLQLIQRPRFKSKRADISTMQFMHVKTVI